MQRGLTCLIATIVMNAMIVGPCIAQGTPDARQADGKTIPADVIVFVNPQPQNSARIGIAYSTRVDHSLVQQDLKRLLGITGWTAANDLSISDASVHPDRPTQYPITTAVELTLLNAPQLQHGDPDVSPYLTAFQRVNHIEVNFISDIFRPFQNIQHVSNKVMDVDLQIGEGLYRYEATIFDHQNALSKVVFPPVAPATPVQTGGEVRPEHSQGAFSFWPIVLMLSGLGLIGCVCAYAWLLKRSPRQMPTASRR